MLGRERCEANGAQHAAPRRLVVQRAHARVCVRLDCVGLRLPHVYIPEGGLVGGRRRRLAILGLFVDELRWRRPHRAARHRFRARARRVDVRNPSHCLLVLSHIRRCANLRSRTQS